MEGISVNEKELKEISVKDETLKEILLEKAPHGQLNKIRSLITKLEGFARHRVLKWLNYGRWSKIVEEASFIRVLKTFFIIILTLSLIKSPSKKIVDLNRTSGQKPKTARPINNYQEEEFIDLFFQIYFYLLFMFQQFLGIGYPIEPSKWQFGLFQAVQGIALLAMFGFFAAVIVVSVLTKKATEKERVQTVSAIVQKLNAKKVETQEDCSASYML